MKQNNNTYRHSWWTWVVPLAVLQLITSLSYQLPVNHDINLLNISLPMAYAMIRWWGSRVIAAVFINGLLSSLLFNSYPLALNVAYALPGTIAIVLSWALPKIFLKQKWPLSNINRTAVFILVGLFVPTVVLTLFSFILLIHVTTYDISMLFGSAWNYFSHDLLFAVTTTIPILLFVNPLVLHTRSLIMTDFFNIPKRHKTAATRTILYLMLASVLLIPIVFNLERQWIIIGVFQLFTAIMYGFRTGAAVNMLIVFTIIFIDPLLEMKELYSAPIIHDMPWGLLNLTLLSVVSLVTGRTVDDYRIELSRRNNAEEKLKLSEEKFSSAFRNVPVLIAISNIETGLFTDINDTFLQTLGFTRKEVIGKTSSELNIFNNYEDRTSVLSELKEKGFARNREIKIRTNTGNIVIGNFSADIITLADGKHLLTTMSDISDLKQIETNLRSSLVEKEVLIKEIHHRVKNNIQLILSLLNMHFKDTTPEFRSLSEQAITRIRSLAIIQEKLYYSNNFTEIDFKEYISTLVHSLSVPLKNNPDLIKINGDSILISIDQAIPAGIILNELLTNAIKYAAPVIFGDIIISISQINDLIYLEIQDIGQGLPENFSLDSPKTIGATLISLLSKQLHADISYTNAHGTHWKIIFSKQKLVH